MTTEKQFRAHMAVYIKEYRAEMEQYLKELETRFKKEADAFIQQTIENWEDER